MAWKAAVLTTTLGPPPSRLKMIYIKNYYTWAAVEYYLLHYVLKQYDNQKRRKKYQISNKELDYLEIDKWDNMIKNNIFL